MAEPDDVTAKQIAEQCRRVRRQLHVSMRQLADTASVSIRMIVRMEKTQRVREALIRARNAERDKSRRDFVRVMVQICIALGLEERAWADRVSLISEEELQAVIVVARERVQLPKPSEERPARPLAQAGLVVLQVVGYPSDPIIVRPEVLAILRNSAGADLPIVTPESLLKRLASRYGDKLKVNVES